MALRILLAEAELELVPESIAGHAAVRRHADVLRKKATQCLLDQNPHRQAMRDLPDAARRGRPDIVQNSLLATLESPLCRSGGLEVAIHTRNMELIRIRNDTRLPRGESRFQGVMARVLGQGASHDKDPLIWVEGRKKPVAALQAFAKGPVVRMDEGGGRATPYQVADLAQGKELTLVIGAFPRGDWSPEWQQAAPTTASIWPEALTAWNVAGELMAAFRARHGPAWME